MVSYFTVADIDGIDFKIENVKLNDNEKIDRCEQVIRNYPNPPQYKLRDSSRADYSPMLDYINMPPIEQHDNSDQPFSMS